jgi:hypothetical protein
MRRIRFTDYYRFEVSAVLLVRKFRIVPPSSGVRHGVEKIAVMNTLTLVVLEGDFAVSRLPPYSAIPEWAMAGSFISITRTGDVLSIVCLVNNVPAGAGGHSRIRGIHFQYRLLAGET